MKAKKATGPKGELLKKRSKRMRKVRKPEGMMLYFANSNVASASPRTAVGHDVPVRRRDWSEADERVVFRLAEGAVLANADDIPDVSHLSDDEFMKLLVG